MVKYKNEAVRWTTLLSDDISFHPQYGIIFFEIEYQQLFPSHVQQG